MDVGLVVVMAAVAFLALAGVAWSTGTGQRRRGGGRLVSIAAAVFFPLTWIVWYRRDRRSLERVVR